jgi:ATP-dependent DNA helicase PIF1
MRVNLRYESANIFSTKLPEIGDGRIVMESSGNIKLTTDFCYLVSSVAELIDAVYPGLSQNYLNLDWLRERVILAPKNEDVNELIDLILIMLPGVVNEYKSIDTVVDDDQVVNFPQEFLNSLDPAGLPPHRLLLKMGCPILLIRNIDPPKLCNGTRLCQEGAGYVIEATILPGNGEGETSFIPLIPLIPTDMPFKFKRLQFPVRVAFAITINKSQGQSIKYCGVDLRTPCFSHGQLYV